MPPFEHETAQRTFSEIFADWYRNHLSDHLVRTDGHEIRCQHQSKQPDSPRDLTGPTSRSSAQTAPYYMAFRRSRCLPRHG